MCRSSGRSRARRPRTRTDVLAGTLDIAATILDRAKVEPYNGLQGVSLLPVIEGTNTDVARDSLVIEDDQQRAVFGLPPGSRLRTLVTAPLAHDHRPGRSLRRALRPAERSPRDGQSVRGRCTIAACAPS